MKLLIVESPGKTKKIQDFLGSDWKVMASVGHVRDLPEKELGVAAPDFRPAYVASQRGKEVLGRLAAAVKSAEAVFLATDPDREGEAIAWHIADALYLKNALRVTYSEITEKAIKGALNVPRSIDMALVAAQEGRRVLDRLCGYMVSGPLSRAAGARLSAGRVQSPAVRLVVERERDIQAHKVTTHYGVQLTFEVVDNITDGWTALWKPWLEEGQQYFLDKLTSEKVSMLRTLTVVGCQESESRVAPPAPFTTSSLQQAASNSLKFNPKKTMDLAQKLYEQGYISYMRTDSPNLSEEAVVEIRAFCEAKDWPVVGSPRKWKSKDGAQEAHEAIRPTHIEVEEGGETSDEKALYSLIRLRSLASQLDDALYAIRILQLSGEVDGKEALFEAKGRTLLLPGWKVLMVQDQADDPDLEQEPDNPVPAFKSGDQVTAITGRLQTKKTKPAPRFTEASLVRELEKRGIGRPSTYAAIMSNITAREYVKVEKRLLVPTPLGEAVVDHLKGNFAFIDYDFTRKMEEDLDIIAEGKAEYKRLITDAYAQLQKEVERFQKGTALFCPGCTSDQIYHLVKRATKTDAKEYDLFACRNCDAAFANENGKPGRKIEKREKVLSEFKCKEVGCGKALVRRQGTGKGGEYDFFGCSGYPKCRGAYNVKDNKPDYEAKR